MKTFKQFFESYDLPEPKHNQLVAIYPFDGQLWSKENTKVFNSLSSTFPQSHHCITIGMDGQLDTSIKRKIIECCGIHPSQIIECNNPFEPFTVIHTYDIKTDSMVMLLEKEQINRIKDDKKFKKYTPGKLLPIKQCVYYCPIKSNKSKYSFNEILQKFNKIPDTVGRRQFVSNIFGDGCDFETLENLLDLGGMK